MSKVFVNQKGAKRIRKGHLWIYKSDVLKIDADGGDVVSVFDEAKNFVGKAFYSDSSEITLRIFTVKKEEIDRDYWKNKIIDAYKRRPPLENSNTNSMRVVNSEGDLIPSLIVDFYNGIFVIQTLTQGTEKLKQTFVEILRDEFSPQTIVERNDARVRLLEKLEIQNSVLYGEVPAETVIEQDGIKFFITPLEGQKTGSFLDQRENHFVARKYAFGRALDCFTFNGGFALNIAASCEKVTALDISDEAINLAKRNAELNKISNVDFQTANVFDALRDLEKSGEKFDTIILDPPAFVKNRNALKQAVRGYKEINLRALKLLNPNGILLTCSCSYHFTEEIFLQTMEEAVRDSRRKVHLVEKRMQASDHPILVGMPETYYLKCFIFRVIE